jgi:membrane associated rhomboid family serine protease
MDFLNRVKYNFQQQGILTQIIVVNVAVFLTVNIAQHIAHVFLLEYLALPLGGAHFLVRFWTIFTYMFTHEGLGHLFWNMVLFYFFAQVFFTIMGQKKMLYLYVMSGLCGGALMLLLGILFPGSFGRSYLIGASAAVLGVGAVMAVYSPNYRIFLFGMFEMSYKYFFLLVFVVNTIIDLSVNTGGKISHIGGTIFGLVYGYYLKKGNDLFDISLSFPKKRLKVVHNKNAGVPYNDKGRNNEKKMDELLDKISRSGYDSLTKSEKDELFRLSQKK